MLAAKPSPDFTVLLFSFTINLKYSTALYFGNTQLANYYTEEILLQACLDSGQSN